MDIRRLFEHRNQQLLPPSAFRIRLAKYCFAAGLFLSLALGVGMVGYHRLEQTSWLDSFLNASMILDGMGPVTELKTDDGKLFAGIYALFSGLVFLMVAGLILSPIVHRLLHKFHFDENSSSNEP